MLYQTGKAHGQFSTAIRRCSHATVAIVRPMLLTCIIMICAYAVVGPPTSWDVAYSVQDIIIVHSVVAFLPEVIGTGFMVVTSVFEKLFDDSVTAHTEVY